MMGLMTAALNDAAEFERDRRLARAADAIAAGGDAQAIAIDCQCWTAIAAWLDTDRFMGFYGGADPGAQPGTVGEDGRATKDPPWIGWPQLEAAALKALTHVTDKTAEQEAKPGHKLAELADLHRRRARLFAIHRKLQLRRESIDIINAQIRAERERTASVGVDGPRRQGLAA